MKLALWTCAAIAACTFSVACRSSAGGASPDGVPPETAQVETTQIEPAAVEPDAPPMVIDGEVDSNWEYLRLKYDVDGDGAISSKEYDRDPERFARLDRDSDGLVSETDFQSSGGRGSMRARMQAMRAERAMGEAFQEDDDLESLELEELEASFALYDQNDDTVIDREEFEARASERAEGEAESEQPSRGSRDPYDTMLAAIDEDQDECLGAEELFSFFETCDRDSDGVVKLAPDMSARSGGMQDASGVAEGEWAPDFSLQPPDGGQSVTLSSFREDKPVALIFGSYT